MADNKVIKYLNNLPSANDLCYWNGLQSHKRHPNGPNVTIQQYMSRSFTLTGVECETGKLFEVQTSAKIPKYINELTLKFETINIDVAGISVVLEHQNYMGRVDLRTESTWDTLGIRRSLLQRMKEDLTEGFKLLKPLKPIDETRKHVQTTLWDAHLVF